MQKKTLIWLGNLVFYKQQNFKNGLQRVNIRNFQLFSDASKPKITIFSSILSFNNLKSSFVRFRIINLIKILLQSAKIPLRSWFSLLLNNTETKYVELQQTFRDRAIFVSFPLEHRSKAPKSTSYRAPKINMERFYSVTLKVQYFYSYKIKQVWYKTQQFKKFETFSF